MKSPIIRFPALLILTPLIILIMPPLMAKEPARPSIIIEGIEAAESDEESIEENIRSSTDLSGYECDLPHWRLTRLGEITQKNTEQVLRARGYYRPKIKLEIEQNQGCWSLKLAI